MKAVLLIFLLATAWAIALGQDNGRRINFAVSTGYQSSDLHWSIAGNENGTSPNVYSELKWKAISGPQFNSTLKVRVAGIYFVGGEYSRSNTTAGHATDADYGADNRTQAIYNAELDSDEGNLINYRLYAGANLCHTNKLTLACFAGFTADNELLLLLQHDQYLPGQRNLRTTYTSNWKGALAGLSAKCLITNSWSLTAKVIYSQLKYNAVADWNMIDAFKHPVSFEQNATGFDLSNALILAYHFNTHFALISTVSYNYAETGKGTDRLYLDSGDIRFTQFNGAVKNTKSITLGGAINF